MKKTKEIRNLKKAIDVNCKTRSSLYTDFCRMSEKLWNIEYSMIDQKYYMYKEVEDWVYLKFLSKEYIKGKGLVLYFEKVYPFQGDYGFLYYSRYSYEAYNLVGALKEKKLKPILEVEYNIQFKSCLRYITTHGEQKK